MLSVDYCDDDDLSLVDCPICLESLTELIPKVLQCGHSLCETCLLQILDYNHNAKCPKCRKQTPVPRKTTEKLPTNFDLKDISDIPGKVAKMCQICIQRKDRRFAVTYCQDCYKKLCQKCCMDHAEIPIYEKHKLSSLKPNFSKFCTKHKEDFVYMCDICNLYLCSSCVFEHQTHKDNILLLKDVEQKARQLMKNAKKSLNRYLDLLKRCKSSIENQVFEIEVKKAELNKAYTGDEETLENANLNLELYESKMNQIYNELESKKSHIVMVMEELEEMDLLAEGDVEVLDKAKVQQDLAESVMFEVWKAMHEPYTIPVINKDEETLINLKMYQPAPVLDSVMDDGQLNGNLFSFICDINLEGTGTGNLRVELATALVALPDESVLITDLTSDTVHRIDITGHVIKDYSSRNIGPNPSISVVDNKLFLAKHDLIAEINLDTGETECEYKPKVHIDNITAVTYSKILIINSVAGTIVEYDPTTGRIDTVIDGLDNPTQVTLVQGYYIVLTPGATSQIQVYEENWQLYSVISDLRFQEPEKRWSLSSLFSKNAPKEDDNLKSMKFVANDTGNILLISDVIKEITLEGELVSSRQMSTEDQWLSNPIAVSQKGGLLWLSGQGSIQLFEITRASLMRI